MMTADARRKGAGRELSLASLSGIAAFVVLVVGVAVAMLEIAAAADVLPGGIVRALASPSPRAVWDGVLVEDGQPLNRVGQAIAQGLSVVLLGGVPAAFLSAFLVERRQARAWHASWAPVFTAGLALQLSSLALTVVATAFFTSLAAEVWLDMGTVEALELAPALVPSGGMIVCGIWGISSWRALLEQVEKVNDEGLHIRRAGRT